MKVLNTRWRINTKRIFLSAMVGAGMVAAVLQILSGSEAARPPESYPLVCRGGGTLDIASSEGKLGFTFTHGTKPASDGLDPGQCSWVDRRMYDAEPYRVSEPTEEVVAAPKPGWYGELRSSDKYWTFMVSNNGKGQLIATSAGPNAPFDISPTATATIAAASDRVRTFQNHQYVNDCNKFDPLFPPVDPAPPGTNLVGYINHWNEGGFLGCTTQFNSAFRGTVWFDLSEILSKPGLPKATKATLTFRKILSVANDANGKPTTRVCEDTLQAASEDWMKADFDKTIVASGEFDFVANLSSCPPAGCSIDVTNVVNGWIVHPETRNGFVIVGEDENFLAKLIPKSNDACETRYGDFSLTVNYKYDKAKDTYPFECRGAETLKFIEDGPAGSRSVGFTFIRGTKPAREGLLPGQCSWLDRGMRAGEPARLAQPIEGAGGWSKELNSSDSYWTFNVYSAGERLQATGAERTKTFFVPLLRTNYALASNGATATASSTTPASEGTGNYEPISAINGDRLAVGTTDTYSNNTFWRDGTDDVWPDWLQVEFKGSKRIEEIDVYTLQDDHLKPKDPEGLSFKLDGITDFDVQYWDGYGWTTIESVNGNNQVLRKVFLTKSVTTTEIRVLVRKALNRRSRIVELEAWGK
jgi:hypothetical protein